MPTSFENSGAISVKEVFALRAQRSQDTRLGMKLFPVVEKNVTKLVYERHRLFRGLQYHRGMQGPTQPVALPGFDKFMTEPGYYGDHVRITEKDLVERRKVGSWTDFDEQGDVTGNASLMLEQRQSDRIEKNVFDVMCTGIYEGADAQGRVGFTEAYAIQKYTPGTLFSDLANSYPLKYFRDTIATAEKGISVNFRGGSMLMNRPTLNTILGNTNSNDLGGKRFDVGQTLNSVAEFNEILVANDLPTVQLYDEGWYTEGDSGAFNRFIPDGKIVILGKRTDGETVGEYWVTRAAQNGNKPGYWVNVLDHSADGDPPQILVKAGHNGGPKIWYPEAVLCISGY